MPSPTLLKKASLKQLENEIGKRKQAKITELKNKKAEIDQTIKSLSGSIVVGDKASPAIKKSTKIRKAMHKNRVINDKSLKDLLVSIASDGIAHTTTEFVTSLENIGWKSTSAKPYYVVAAALASLSNKNIFRRVAKGSYALVNNEGAMPVVDMAPNDVQNQE